MVSLKTAGVIAAAAVIAMATPACSDNTLSQLASSTTASGIIVTDTLTGTLTPNGAFQQIFTIQSLGAVTVTIASLSPNSTQIVGLSLGVWTGTQCSVSPQTGGAANDIATSGTSISLNATAAGNLCFRIYDVGFVTTPVFYTVQVTHP